VLAYPLACAIRAGAGKSGAEGGRGLESGLLTDSGH